MNDCMAEAVGCYDLLTNNVLNNTRLGTYNAVRGTRGAYLVVKHLSVALMHAPNGDGKHRRGGTRKIATGEIGVKVMKHKLMQPFR